MSREISQEQREELVFQLAELLNFTSDEYLTKLMDNVSIDYAKGYLDSFLANATDEDIRLFYQIVKMVNIS